MQYKLIMESWRKFLLKEEKNVADMPFPEQQIIDKAYELIELAAPEAIKSSPVLNRIIFHDSPGEDSLGHYFSSNPQIFVDWIDHYFGNEDAVIKVKKIFAKNYDRDLTGAQKRTDNTAFVNLADARISWSRVMPHLAKKGYDQEFLKEIGNDKIVEAAIFIASTIVHEVAHAVEPRKLDKIINQKIEERLQKAIEAGLFDFNEDTRKITGVSFDDLMDFSRQMESELDPLKKAARDSSEIYAYRVQMQFMEKLKTKWSQAGDHSEVIRYEIEMSQRQIKQYSTNKR